MLRQPRAALRGVMVYKELMDAPAARAALRLLDALDAGEGEGALTAYTDLFYLLRKEGYAGPGAWLWDALRYGESPYAAALDAGGADKALETAAQRDVKAFLELAGLDCGALKGEIGALLGGEYGSVLAGLPGWESGAPFDFDSLTAFYREQGYGVFARYRAFLWEDGALTPVPDPDCMGEEVLQGYEWQRREVVENTRALMAGRQVNNVLLYGDSGTGKSVTVKSLLTVPEFGDLRLIEVDKTGLADLPHLIRTLAGRRQKFIIFIDDLAFDQDDRTYSALKTILEGGLEKRPANVAVYATSNRRNLVRQTFSDRAGDEVDMVETIQEKTSLAERFGLRIPYLNLSKPEFLALVERLGSLHGVAMEREALRAEAVKWEMHHPGRTPRTARQFILSLSL